LRRSRTSSAGEFKSDDKLYSPGTMIFHPDPLSKVGFGTTTGGEILIVRYPGRPPSVVPICRAFQQGETPRRFLRAPIFYNSFQRRAVSRQMCFHPWRSPQIAVRVD
jgi:hypothetical protein